MCQCDSEKVKRLFNTQPEAIQYIEQAACIKGPRAVRVAFIYGFLQSLKPTQGRVRFNPAFFSKSYGFTRESVRNDLQLIEDMGWAEVSPDFSSTYLVLHGIPFDEMEVPLPGDDSEASMGCKSGFHGVESEASMGLEGGLSTYKKSYKKSSKKSNKKSNKKSSCSPPSENQKKKLGKDQLDELLKIWNEHKPRSFAAHQRLPGKIEESLLKHIKGERLTFEEFSSRLAVLLEKAKDHKFFRDTNRGKKWSWANFVGGSSGFQDRFATDLEALDDQPCQASKPNSPNIEERVERDIVSGEWWPRKSNMSDKELKEAIANAERLEQEQTK